MHKIRNHLHGYGLSFSDIVNSLWCFGIVLGRNTKKWNFWEKTLLKRDFHASFSADVKSVVYQTENTKKSRCFRIRGVYLILKNAFSEKWKQMLKIV